MVENHFNGSEHSLMYFDDEPHILENIYIQVGLVLLYTFIFVLCFFGNLAVILVVSLQWKRRSVSKFCLGNMAVANFSVSLFCILQNLTMYLLDTWIFGELMCKLYNFITNLCHSASILILVSISIERYVVLLHPFRCRQILTTRTLILTTLSVWILSAGISLPRLFYFGLVRIQLNENGDFGDICVPIKSMYNSATADTIYFVLMYLTPLAAVSVMYLRIGLFLRRSERLRRDLDEDNAGVHVTSASRDQLRASQKQPNDVSDLDYKPIREAYSAPVDLGSISTPSDASSFSVIFTLRGQTLQQQDNMKNCLSMKGLRKWRNHPKCALRFVSPVEHAVHSDGPIKDSSTKQDSVRCKDTTGPYVIREKVLIGAGEGSYKIKRCGGGELAGDHQGSQSTTTSSASSSTLHQRAAVAINPEAQRDFYRYNILHLSYIRCKQRQRVVRMLVFIVLTFAVLNLPYHVRKLCLNYSQSFDMASDANNLIAPLTFALMYANCALNPILYAFLSKHFRASLSDFCGKYCCCKVERNSSAI